MFGLTRPGIEPVSTMSVANTLSIRPLIGYGYVNAFRASINYNDECVRSYKESTHPSLDAVHSREIKLQDDYQVIKVNAQTSTDDLPSTNDDQSEMDDDGLGDDEGSS